jgi:hypothetical protein
VLGRCGTPCPEEAPHGKPPTISDVVRYEEFSSGAEIRSGPAFPMHRFVALVDEGESADVIEGWVRREYAQLIRATTEG